MARRERYGGWGLLSIQLPLGGRLAGVASKDDWSGR
jgi:hypothetical protein